jgi:hypothetical protein
MTKNNKNGKKNGALVKKNGALAVMEEITNMFGGDTPPQIPIDAPLPQVKILRETPQFEMPDGETTKSFVGHILYYHNANQYYKDPYGEGDGNGVPTCASSDGIAPDGGEIQEPGPCRDCPKNEYGSADEGKGKACQNTIRLYILQDGEVLPCVLKAPPSSLGKKESLIRWLTNAPNIAAKAGIGTKYQPIKVQFSLHTKDFSSGMSASVIDLETVSILDPNNSEDHDQLVRLAALYKDFRTHYIGRISTDVANEPTTQEEIPI